MSNTATNSTLKRLQEALGIQRAYLAQYERPSEPLAYETLRTLDDLFLRDLMEPARSVSKNEPQFRRLSSWGVNHALRRIIPKVPASCLFRDFPSVDQIQAQADDFVFNCAALELAERFEGWLRDGIVSGELRPYPKPDRQGMNAILVLRSNVPSCYDEEIAMTGLRWANDVIAASDTALERTLEDRHRQLEPELEGRVELVDGWRVAYTSTKEIDDYFLEWARLYLRRIFSQGMIGPNDVIGGRPFSRYIEVLSVLSGRSQKHIAFAAILKARYPSVHIRNLLTTYCQRDSLFESVARRLDADRSEIETILGSFILTGNNLEIHTGGASTAWAPVVQASTDTLILPVYGLDINPFLFLLNDLRYRYKQDWFKVANNRERRWIEEITGIFDEPRWQTHGRNLRLREGGNVVTDIDFAVLERQANELALFQLKWQHPVGLDNRGRRSAGSNLIVESNRWINAVVSWLERHGVDELMRRLACESSVTPTVHLFVLGRYHVHLTGFDQRDSRAVWSDWAHFQRACAEGPRTATVSQIASILQMKVDQSSAMKTGESIMFPVGDLALVVNPTTVPHNPLEVAEA